MEDKRLEDGTVLLAFHCNNKIDPICKGVVIESELSRDLSLYGTPWHKWIYSVQEDDGTIIRGTYNNAYINSTFFRTKEDNINYLKLLINIKNDEIKELQKLRNEYEEALDKINANDKVKVKK